jgi:hypothetical protein
MSFGKMTFGVSSPLLFAASILCTSNLLVQEAKAEDWSTVELVRTGEMSDTSSPVFQSKDQTGPFGKSKITLRCADEGWGSVSLERVRGRFALDNQLGLKSWPELNKALEKQTDAYLRGERLKFREIFVQDDSGPEHPRDELAAFGDSEKGYKYKFAKFDECSKVDSETLKPGQACVVTLQIKGTSKKSGVTGHVRYRSIKCEAQPGAGSISASPSSAINPPHVGNSVADPRKTGRGKTAP